MRAKDGGPNGTETCHLLSRGSPDHALRLSKPGSHDTPSLLNPKFQRSEVVGIVAGFGTTFAAVPDLVAMLKRRSSAGMNPRMTAIMGAFQVLWVYYGLLILSRPVIAWNLIAVLINFLSVGAYLHFVRKEKAEPKRVLGS
jgi:MtN3 and saliva related transmembrane protein